MVGGGRLVSAEGGMEEALLGCPTGPTASPHVPGPCLGTGSCGCSCGLLLTYSLPPVGAGMLPSVWSVLGGLVWVSWVVPCCLCVPGPSMAATITGLNTFRLRAQCSCGG